MNDISRWILPGRDSFRVLLCHYVVHNKCDVLHSCRYHLQLVQVSLGYDKDSTTFGSAVPKMIFNSSPVILQGPALSTNFNAQTARCIRYAVFPVPTDRAQRPDLAESEQAEYNDPCLCPDDTKRGEHLTNAFIHFQRVLSILIKPYSLSTVSSGGAKRCRCCRNISGRRSLPGCCVKESTCTPSCLRRSSTIALWQRTMRSAGVSSPEPCPFMRAMHQLLYLAAGLKIRIFFIGVPAACVAIYAVLSACFANME